MSDLTTPGGPEDSGIEPVSIVEEMQRSYLDYAMSVIVSRALPDVRDGLKPVHRRVLFAMHDRGLQPDRPYVKSANIVGTVMGEPEAIFPFLGSSRLADAIDRFGNVRAVVHGHAHRGTYEGRTLRDIPVYNCAQFVVRREFDRPYALIEV